MSIFVQLLTGIRTHVHNPEVHVESEGKTVEELYDELYRCWFVARKALGKGIGLVETGKIEQGTAFLNKLREHIKMTECDEIEKMWKE